MIVAIVVGVGLVYVIGSYVLMARDLNKSAGPGGLGWLALPAAPLVAPFIILGGALKLFMSLKRRVFS